MRIYIKGGVWKNSEDEILKAAVMKYGLNNWSRVASLLVRKSAKQCKCRWYDWLDPQVKKTEWTRDEEQKLLHLAKLFPTQWRTIAPLVGRTAYQCLEHYDKLLDQVQGRLQLTEGAAEQGGENAFVADPRRLRPGEIDPNPESKPSRADPVDMDDDEKEMLSEARARLANTRGKKAKRKAREKQLEEARRLASLQKKRELKAAGIAVGSGFKKNRKYIDHSTEIAFEQVPVGGHYEVPSEETPEGNLNFANVSLQQLEGRRRTEEESRNRKDDTRKLKRLQEDDLPKAMDMIDKLNNPQTVRKRTKLSIPSPQLSEDDLVLLTSQSDLSHALVDGSSVAGDTPLRSSTGGLSSRLSTNMRPGSMTPGAAPGSFRGPGSYTPSSTVGSATPFRDDASVVESVDEDPVGTKARQHMLRMQVKTSLANLPQPINEIEARLPEIDDEEPKPLVQEIEEDMADVIKMKGEREKQKREEEFRRASQAVQLNLPRPAILPKRISESEQAYPLNIAEKLLNEEIIHMLAYDAVKYPTGKTKATGDLPPRTDFSDAELNTAKEMLASESKLYESECKHDKPDNVWEESFGLFAYSPSQKRYLRWSEMTATDRLESSMQDFENTKAHLERVTKRTGKLASSYKTRTDGYMARMQTMLKSIDDLFEEHQQLSCDLLAYRTLMTQEAISIEARKHELQQLVDMEKSRHLNLQEQYKELAAAR